MKKLILICLLGYLCVPTSTLPAQVADSPGADFLHRSSPIVSPEQGDTHRGGETRSDTLPGEAAAVTVYLVHRTPESAGNLIVDLWDAEMYGLENFANHQRMEVPQMEPHMLTGLMPSEERGYRFRTPSISGPSILRLSFGDNPVIRDYWVSPGDSIMIQVNPQSSAITFSGPSSFKFRLQKELQEVLSTSVQETDVVLPFNSDDGYRTFLADPENHTAWDTISRSFGRKTSPVVAGKSELVFLKSIDYKKWEAEVSQRVGFYEKWLSEADRMAVKAGILGRLGYIHVGRLQGAYDRVVQLDEPQTEREYGLYISQYADEFAKDIPIETALQVPPFRNFLLSKSKLSADVNGKSFLEQVQGEYPSAVADRLAIQYLSDYRRRIPDFESQAKELLSQVAEPSLKAELEIMLGKFGSGSKVISFDWLGIDGKRIQTDEYKDKVILMDFWISGCGACKAFHEKILSPLISRYAEHPKVEIISVSADRKPDYWQRQNGTLNVPDAGYTPAYAEQEEGKNSFLSHYNIQSFPQWMIIRDGGSLLNLGRVPATLEEAEGLIERALANPTSQTNLL
ncbi:thioredoxin family protein [Algoriphagus sp. Y33]|uniref:TlpA family protein disulfide reductase n=1 Tax=Algoriphagus sp. Y33 TaxID=2772483 RepID=UPI00178143FA|nr:thioredoxin family protein [Algoriphagus sp. Y33]